MMNKRKRVEELGETKHRQVRQRILQEHKNDILENLAFELSDKVRRLRSNASLLASTIRMRGEMRIAAIPRAQRNMRLRDLKNHLSCNVSATPWRTKIKEFYNLDELSSQKSARQPTKTVASSSSSSSKSTTVSKSSSRSQV